MMNLNLQIRHLGKQDYETVWRAMREFTDSRTEKTEDEIWFVQHPPIFTLGQSGKREHILQITDIPILQTDRGGQVTYHGPGQLVAYVLIDIKRKNLGVRRFVTLLEQSIVSLLSEYNISSTTRCSAPGVYVDEKKICSVGLRIRRGCSYHGLALNVDMDLTPFQFINPCGYADLQVTQMKNYYQSLEFNHLCDLLANKMITQLSKSSS